ncbi:alpha/beta hydrolase [Skermanella rosea]|uniref:alpha/beta hydrolase n=1 Tax=Skermanella rosea TaxID=1817965 RepID=UPI0019320FBA|nr:alpha/beta hydrolase [Skermanella rosea]UEM03094.1 alpha/beta hydrolase [Skermanella rosea]
MTDLNASPENTLAHEGATIAYRRTEGSTPGVIFMGGFKSDMTGTKAVALESFCRSRGTAFVRFDYQGHGTSSGRFEEGSIGLWSRDALAVFDRLTEGPQVVVGSSMGGWMMLLTALARPERVAGLIGIASAPDFTEDLIWSTLDETDRATLMETGALLKPSDYGDPYPYTRRLIEDGRDHLLLRGTIPLACPVRLLHGMRDADVPWRTSQRIAERLAGDDVRITLVKDGDHRLSRDQDIALLCRTVGELLDGLKTS